MRICAQPNTFTTVRWIFLHLLCVFLHTQVLHCHTQFISIMSIIIPSIIHENKSLHRDKNAAAICTEGLKMCRRKRFQTTLIKFYSKFATHIHNCLERARIAQHIKYSINLRDFIDQRECCMLETMTYARWICITIRNEWEWRRWRKD